MSNENPIYDFPKDPEAAASEKRLDEAFQRLEDKVDAITDYMEGRRALYQDFYADEINEAELDAGLRRLWFRLRGA